MRKEFIFWLALGTAALPGRAQEIFVGMEGGNIVAVSKTGEVRPFAEMSPDLVLITAMAMDVQGRIFVSYADNDGKGYRIVRLDPGGQRTIVDAPGATPVRALTLDDEGHFYILSYDGGKGGVLRLSLGETRETMILVADTGWAEFSFAGIACGADGTIYFTEFGKNQVSKIDPRDGLSVVAGGIPSPVGLGLGGDGTIFVGGSGGIYRVSPEGAVRLWATHPAWSQALGIAVDAEDNVFLTARGSDVLYKVTRSGAITELARGLRNANVVAIRPSAATGPAWGAAGLVLAVFAGITLVLLLPLACRGRRPEGRGAV